MSDEQVTAGDPDDPQGDYADQAQRLQAVDEQQVAAYFDSVLPR